MSPEPESASTSPSGTDKSIAEASSSQRHPGLDGNPQSGSGSASNASGTVAQATEPVGLGDRLGATFESLKYRDFLYLWIGTLLMMGGMQMQMVARGYLTYDITSSPFLLGLVNAGFALPMLALALFGGAIADRMDRKRVIQLGQGSAGIIALFVAVSIATGAVTWVHLLVASMFQGALFSFLMPARQAIIPSMVGRENLNNAMALSAAAMSTTTLVAPAVAGVLYAIIGPDGVYYIVVAMSLGAVAVTGLIAKSDAGPTRPSVPMLQDIGDGLTYIRRTPLVLVLLAMGLATAVLAMPFRFLMPVFVVDVYNKGPEALGLLVSVMGAGSLVGALFIASMGRWRRGMVLLMGSFLSAVGLLLVALIPVYLVAVFIMLVLGLGDATRRTLMMALTMEEVEDQYRGRVMSVFMMNFGLMPLGVLPAGLAAEFLGGQAAAGLLGGLLLAATAYVMITQKRLRDVR